MSVDYGKKSRLSFTVWACPQIATASLSCTTVVCAQSLLEHTDLTVVMDSEALYDRKSDIELSRLLEQFISSLGAPLRYDGALCGCH